MRARTQLSALMMIHFHGLDRRDFQLVYLQQLAHAADHSTSCQGQADATMMQQREQWVDTMMQQRD